MFMSVSLLSTVAKWETQGQHFSIQTLLILRQPPPRHPQGQPACLACARGRLKLQLVSSPLKLQTLSLSLKLFPIPRRDKSTLHVLR